MCGSGGLGLTGGIADAGCLFDALMGIHYRLADDRILDVYSDIRKQIWIDIIDPMSRVNFERLLARDANAVGDNDPFFQDCVKAETDDKLAAKLAMVSFFFLSFVLLLRLGIWIYIY